MSEDLGHGHKQGRLLYRLLKWLLPITAFFVLLSIISIYIQIRPVLERREIELQRELGMRSAHIMQHYIIGNLAVIRTISQAPGMVYMEYERQLVLVENAVILNDGITEVSLTDYRGREIIRISDTEVFSREKLRDLSGDPIFLESREGKVVLSEVSYSSNGEPFQRFAIPIFREGEVVGMLVGIIKLLSMSDELATFQVGKSGISYIIDNRGKLIAHHNRAAMPVGSQVNNRKIVLNLVNGEEVTAFGEDSYYVNENGKEVVASSFYVGHPDIPLLSGGMVYGVVVEREVSEAMAPLRLLVFLIAITSTVMMIMLSLATFLASRMVLNPLSHLKEGAIALAAGNMDHRVAIRSGDELEALGNSFNKMAERLQKSLKLLSDSEARIRTILETMPEGVVLRDRDGEILYVNPAYERLFGYRKEDIEGRDKIASLIAPESKEKVKEHMSLRERGISSTFEASLITKGGNKRPVMITGTPIMDSAGEYQGRLAIFTDISEIKKLQEEKERILRLAAIGEIAAMVSHEFRNSLGAITNSVYVLRSRLQSPDEKVKKNLINISHAVSSSVRTIGNLLDFARPTEPSFKPISINETVKQAVQYVGFPDAVNVSEELQPGLPTLWADQEMLIRVFVNLFLNAIDAMPLGGKLNIRTGSIDGYIEVRVEDTGSGLKPDVLPKLFEPFFTTKNKGTGLGLYASKRIIEKHGGEIKVESGHGKGVTVIVRLPLRNNQLC